MAQHPSLSLPRLALWGLACLSTVLIVFFAVAATVYDGGESLIGATFVPCVFCIVFLGLESLLIHLGSKWVPGVLRWWLSSPIWAALLLLIGGLLVWQSFLDLTPYTDPSTGFRYYSMSPLIYLAIPVVWFSLANWPLRNQRW